MQRITVFKLTLNHRHIVTYIALRLQYFRMALTFSLVSQYLSVSQSCHKIGPQVEVSASILSTVVLRDCVLSLTHCPFTLSPSLSLQETLHSYLWYCRYIAFFAGIILYMWEWLSYRDHTLLLTELHQNTDLIMARLGIKSPLNQKRASSSVAMHGVQPDMQGGPPPPNRHSWPSSARGGSKEKEVHTIYL